MFASPKEIRFHDREHFGVSFIVSDYRECDVHRSEPGRYRKNKRPALWQPFHYHFLIFPFSFPQAHNVFALFIIFLCIFKCECNSWVPCHWLLVNVHCQDVKYVTICMPPVEFMYLSLSILLMVGKACQQILLVKGLKILQAFVLWIHPNTRPVHTPAVCGTTHSPNSA